MISKDVPLRAVGEPTGSDGGTILAAMDMGAVPGFVFGRQDTDLNVQLQALGKIHAQKASSRHNPNPNPNPTINSSNSPK